MRNGHTSVSASPPLSERYERSSGRVLLTGTQALVRLLLEQSARDAARGLRTAGFVSGYRGSPLGGLDRELWGARERLAAADVRFEPGVNEDLAATAIWGTQQMPLLPRPRRDGIYALWYGKGPGVDRSGDPLKHGNRMGASRHGGVLVAFGDDHPGKSSTVSHQSEPVLAAHQLPVLYPATLQEYLDFGLHGWALSRCSGLWVGFKCINETVEATATVEIDPARVRIVEATDIVRPPEGLNGRMAFDPLGDEMRLVRYRIPAALAYVRANALDRVALGSHVRRLGIVAAGKSYLDVLEALSLLGLDARRAGDLGISLYKPALIWPLEPEGLRRFARGTAELLFVEEKRRFLEEQAAGILYNVAASERPRIVGKADERGAPLLAADVPLDPVTIALAIARRLALLDVSDEALNERTAALVRTQAERAQLSAAPTVRTPYFCAGCPHSTSTRVPEDSLAFSGIGCHTLAIAMNRNTATPTHMGGEGVNWVGIAPYTEVPHVFQNLGDGTYFHSGLLAVRAAVTAGVNITYKILVNDAVAMTGGQPVEGQLTVGEITRQLAAERVRRIAVVSDRPELHRRDPELAAGVSVHHRDELARVQRAFRDVPGTSAIVYEQTCANEKRRRRKRGLLADPPQRAFINDRVCEGCGDCSVKSNCVAVEPLETELGRKRRIDQSACNKDFSCIQGFCPSFVLVRGGRVRRPDGANFTADSPLPAPRVAPLEGATSILIAGTGGTGVVTIGAVLAMAAHLEGRAATVFDMTGLAQKGGAVTSHLRIAASADALTTPRIGAGGASVLLGCDLVVSAAVDALHAIHTGRTAAVLNEHLTATAQFQSDPDVDFQATMLLARVRAAIGGDRLTSFDATDAARQLLGDTLAVNMMIVGAAAQLGYLPVAIASIEKALELNGTAVALNKQALFLGRLFVHAPDAFRAGLREARSTVEKTTSSLEALIEHRSRWLTSYQDEAYAQRYVARVRRIAAEEAKRCPGRDALAFAVARQYFRVLAYKDEYEVARLYTDGEFHRELRRQFDGDVHVRVLLSPPLMARTDPASGEPRKLSFGPWIFAVFRVLARLKFLRGTRFDPFGFASERRRERALIEDYEAWIDALVERVSPESHATCVELAEVPARIRGFGHVKQRNEIAARVRAGQLLQALRADSRVAGECPVEETA
jgi:indolepyruvate ferredoxin oxidoreductase